VENRSMSWKPTRSKSGRPVGGVRRVGETAGLLLLLQVRMLSLFLAFHWPPQRRRLCPPASQPCSQPPPRSLSPFIWPCLSLCGDRQRPPATPCIPHFSLEHGEGRVPSHVRLPIPRLCPGACAAIGVAEAVNISGGAPVAARHRVLALCSVLKRNLPSETAARGRARREGGETRVGRAARYGIPRPRPDPVTPRHRVGASNEPSALGFAPLWRRTTSVPDTSNEL
jgi:hypothetical protein